MTVMFPRFFGVPHGVVRLEKLMRLSGVALKLYIALCHESERYRTREIKRTVKQLQKLVGGAPNSHAKARHELRSAGLVEFEELGAEGFVFRLCDPETGEPWLGDPKIPVSYPKKSAQQQGSSQIVNQPDPPSPRLPRRDSTGTVRIATDAPSRVGASAAPTGNPAFGTARVASNSQGDSPETDDGDINLPVDQWGVPRGLESPYSPRTVKMPRWDEIGGPTDRWS